MSDQLGRARQVIYRLANQALLEAEKRGEKQMERVRIDMSKVPDAIYSEVEMLQREVNDLRTLFPMRYDQPEPRDVPIQPRATRFR